MLSIILWIKENWEKDSVGVSVILRAEVTAKNEVIPINTLWKYQ